MVNTGWTGGAYGIGKRINLPSTRAIIDAILDGSIETVSFENFPIFNFKIPTQLPGVDAAILNPRNTWSDKEAYDQSARQLGDKFVTNFKRFVATPSGKALFEAGPK